MLLFEISKNKMNINTSYPLKKELWNDFLSSEDIFDKTINNLSFYANIPFCNEYNKNNNIFPEDQFVYLKELEKQALKFKDKHNIKLLHGFDIGGNNPTSLNDKNFKELMIINKKILKGLKLSSNFCQSIDGSFSTMNEEKIKMLVDAGIKRISFRIKEINSENLQSNNHETNPLFKMEEVITILKRFDIKINLEFMYGINDQTEDMIISSLNILDMLLPDHVSIYETKYNKNEMKRSLLVTKEEVYKQYKLIFEILTKEKGYKSKFGMNTFTKLDDRGLSSYLEEKIFNFTPYKSFGFSAESMSYNGLTYNNEKNIKDFKNIFKDTEIKEEFIYMLPKDEIVGKYVCNSLYSGSLDLNIMSKILEEDAQDYFYDEIQFLIDRYLIRKNCNEITLTKEGFKYYGAVGSLFYGKKNKEYILNNFTL